MRKDYFLKFRVVKKAHFQIRKNLNDERIMRNAGS